MNRKVKKSPRYEAERNVGQEFGDGVTKLAKDRKAKFGINFLAEQKNSRLRAKL